MSSAPREERRAQRLPRARRITRSREIRVLFKWGKRSRTAHLDVFDSPSPAPYPRVGVVVPRYKRPVVERNLVKRRLREILRRFVLPRLSATGRNVDVLVRARREAYGAAFGELKAELEQWLERRWSRESSSR
ncbi:MAG TPA: ribonuclease P protein component [Longimicrobiales bacterium]